jgi:hypothetical protein
LYDQPTARGAFETVWSETRTPHSILDVTGFALASQISAHGRTPDPEDLCDLFIRFARALSVCLHHAATQIERQITHAPL